MQGVSEHLRLWAAAGVFAVFGGCADILDIPSDPMFVTSGPWRCLQQPEEPAAPERGKATVRIQACNFVSTNCSAPVTGLTASLCDKKDVNCSAPIVSGVQDVNGLLTFEVNTGGPLGVGFDGFVRITAPIELCTEEAVFGPNASLLCGFAPECEPEKPDDNCKLPTFAPSLLFFNPPIRNDLQQPLPLPLVPTSAFQSIASAAGASIDASRGNIFITAMDCDNRPAAGVSLEITQYSDLVTELYIDNGVVSDTIRQTDHSGMGGFLGVPVGFAEVVAFVGAETPMRMGKIGVQAAPFTISYSSIVPSQ